MTELWFFWAAFCVALLRHGLLVAVRLAGYAAGYVTEVYKQ